MHGKPFVSNRKSNDRKMCVLVNTCGVWSMAIIIFYNCMRRLYESSSDTYSFASILLNFSF